MKGVGKDLTTLYEKIKHSKNADSILTEILYWGIKKLILIFIF